MNRSQKELLLANKNKLAKLAKEKEQAERRSQRARSRMPKSNVDDDQTQYGYQTQNLGEGQDLQNQAGGPNEVKNSGIPGQTEVGGGEEEEYEGSNEEDTESDSADIKPLELKKRDLDLEKPEKRREEERFRLEETCCVEAQQAVGDHGVPINEFIVIWGKTHRLPCAPEICQLRWCRLLDAL
ncbi:uncharacterized protein MELLADRAFT_111389 [Melampsora larici-populina 98AG31]|uniref:Uncharacterized protein n=1 Tax=Melampsora larici-populina (strain 98AG31 / pathotype 3-4-7) TaxID=747676 RepID=F4S316_MELLP|nr:uncharacterized protein MELLADRAFT_111389 [Melampsora larici-populina 98AG31]EGG00982.1 hypothetical protein MELLADRAFT_111389 [Melampsora larici-populina 98AG31]